MAEHCSYETPKHLALNAKLVCYDFLTRCLVYRPKVDAESGDRLFQLRVHALSPPGTIAISVISWSEGLCVFTYLSAYLLMIQNTLPLPNAMTPTPVNSQPLPMASMRGSATMAPMHENMLRTKLLAATPEEALRGMNSVSMVVDMAKMSIEPIPKKKLAISWKSGGQQRTPSIGE